MDNYILRRGELVETVERFKKKKKKIGSLMVEILATCLILYFSF